MIAGVSHLQWGNQVLPFMSPLRCNYEEFFKKQKEKNHHWTKCSDDGTKLGVYKEVQNIMYLQMDAFLLLHLLIMCLFVLIYLTDFLLK